MTRPNIRATAQRVLRFVPALPINATTPATVAKLAGFTHTTALRELTYLEKKGLVRRVGERRTRGHSHWIRNYREMVAARGAA